MMNRRTAEVGTSSFIILRFCCSAIHPLASSRSPYFVKTTKGAAPASGRRIVFKGYSISIRFKDIFSWISACFKLGGLTLETNYLHGFETSKTLTMVGCPQLIQNLIHTSIPGGYMPSFCCQMMTDDMASGCFPLNRMLLFYVSG